MAPLSFAGVGWILATLGVSGPLGGVYLGMIGVAVMLVGIYRIRWRNQALTGTLWATAALLVSLVALFLVPVSFVHVLVVALLQTAIGVGLATGVRDCLLGSGDGSTSRPVAHLSALRLLILAAFGLTVVTVIADDLLFQVPETTLAVISLAALLPSLWLGVLLFQLRNEPSVQEHSTRQT